MFFHDIKINEQLYKLIPERLHFVLIIIRSFNIKDKHSKDKDLRIDMVILFDNKKNH